MYNLPPLRETTIVKAGTDTLLVWRRNGKEDFWISKFPYPIGHGAAYAKHTATVRRFMWLQRIWRIGKHFEWSRVRILRAFYVSCAL
jgi:hypothetical protein